MHSGRLPAISAHRGGSEIAAAGTWDSYEAALGTGAEFIECDIRKTADGQLVGYHDELVNHSGPPLSALSYDRLCELVGYEVPKVEKILQLIAGRAIGHLDLKETGGEEEIVDLATDLLGEGRFVVSSTEDASIRRIRDSRPDVRTALSLGRECAGLSRYWRARIRSSELYPLPRIRACGADWVAVNHRLASAGVLRQCGRHGIGAMVWTVNDDPLIARFLRDPRVAVLITDRPQHAVRIRAGLLD